MQLIDFNSLSRSVQERFTATTTGRIDPKPIARAPLELREPLLWSAIIVVALATIVTLVVRGFGDPYSTAALQSLPTLVVEVVCFAAIALGIVRFAVLRLQRKALPYRRGVYAFPTSVIDARTGHLGVYPLGEVASIDGPDASGAVTLTFADGRFVFPGAGDEAKRALDAAVEQARGRSADDARITEMFALDPLQRPRLSAPLGPKESLGKGVPIWARYSFVLVPLVGIGLGVALRAGRDRLSDKRMFAATERADDVDTYRAYVARGGARSDEVTRVLLPRAELRQAERAGSVEAIDAYIASHPGSAIAGEVAASRRQALLDDLERAKKEGTLAALQAFALRHPDHGLAPELRSAIHALFAPALESFHGHAPADPQARAMVERLFAYCEAKAQGGSTDTTVQIRFRKRPSKNLWKSDKMVETHSWFMGEVSYPSRYFDLAHATVRDSALAKELGGKFGEEFGPTVFSFQEGPRLEETQEDLPKVTVPTLFITHEEEWPNTFDGSITGPRGIWIDVTFSFDAVWMIPGDPSPPAPFTFTVIERIPQKVVKDNPKGGTPSDPLETKIYESEAAAAYAAFEAKYLAVFVPAKGATALGGGPKGGT